MSLIGEPDPLRRDMRRRGDRIVEERFDYDPVQRTRIVAPA